ncbi:MAG: class I SAM-dependent methyltransferase [Ignavibacteriaceae bacterium]|nr:class I SAM-dependent methyltransferase [Ignavibacteriaceae bacterium]
MINVDPIHFLRKEDERTRYLEHENGIHNDGYVNFLDRAIKPALKYFNKNMTGLDYGCGYAPTISKLLERVGYCCENYDPIFFPGELNKKYDFIFSTEVFEHFFHPIEEINKLVSLLKNNGLLIIMTERWEDEEQFSNWYYTRDPSHVAFYHNQTFDYICNNFLFERIYDDGSRVVILKKTGIL